MCMLYMSKEQIKLILNCKNFNTKLSGKKGTYSRLFYLNKHAISVFKNLEL